MYRSSVVTVFRFWISSLRTGLQLTFRHLLKSRKKVPALGISDERYFDAPEGRVTIEYPREQIPLPVNARYRLHMETEDCIVCDQCARICPVNCITIEGIKSTEPLGLTSDGTKKKIWLPTFDIDMAKCCYCGLCTTVCPTECLTMSPVYDFSEFDRDLMNYHFGNLSPEMAAAKRAEAEALETARKAAKAAAAGGAQA